MLFSMFSPRILDLHQENRPFCFFFLKECDIMNTQVVFTPSRCTKKKDFTAFPQAKGDVGVTFSTFISAFLFFFINFAQ